MRSPRRTAVITPDFRVRSTHRLIARSYLRSWALLDMAAGLPFLTLINIKGTARYGTAGHGTTRHGIVILCRRGTPPIPSPTRSPLGPRVSRRVLLPAFSKPWPHTVCSSLFLIPRSPSPVPHPLSPPRPALVQARAALPPLAPHQAAAPAARNQGVGCRCHCFTVVHSHALFVPLVWHGMGDGRTLPPGNMTLCY